MMQCEAPIYFHALYIKGSPPKRSAWIRLSTPSHYYLYAISTCKRLGSHWSSYWTTSPRCGGIHGAWV